MPLATTRPYPLADFAPAIRHELQQLARSAHVQPRFRQFSPTRWWCSVSDSREPRRITAAIAKSPIAALQLAIDVR